MSVMNKLTDQARNFTPHAHWPGSKHDLVSRTAHLILDHHVAEDFVADPSVVDMAHALAHLQGSTYEENRTRLTPSARGL